MNRRFICIFYSIGTLWRVNDMCAILERLSQQKSSVAIAMSTHEPYSTQSEHQIPY